MNKTNVDEYNTQNGKLIKTTHKSKNQLQSYYLGVLKRYLLVIQMKEKNLYNILMKIEVNIKENIKFK